MRILIPGVQWRGKGRVSVAKDNFSQSTSAARAFDYRSYVTSDLLSRSSRFNELSQHVYHVAPNLVVKTGDHVRMTEADTMRFVRANTSIPVPEVYDAFVRNDTGQVCIVMAYIQGTRLDVCWPSLTKTQKTSLINELKEYMIQLRAVQKPRNIGRRQYIGCVDGTHCEDQFFDHDPTSYGPFNSEAQFTRGLVRALRANSPSTWTEMTCRFIQQLPSHVVVFTHNDLAPRNILVQNGKISAIIDWEMAGFYPEHWEYVKAHLWADWGLPWIREGLIDKILRPYTLELACFLHARDLV